MKNILYMILISLTLSNIANADLVDFRKGNSNINLENKSLDFDIIANINLSQSYGGSKYFLASSVHNAIAIVSCMNGGVVSGGNYVTVKINDRNNSGKVIFAHYHQRMIKCEEGFNKAIENNSGVNLNFTKEEYSFMLNRNSYGIK